MATNRRIRGDGGAALVEFALVAPLLILLVFGIIEFGWAFSQNLDVRHGARETARLAAVNYKPNASATPAGQSADIVAAACGRMDGDANVHVLLARPNDSTTGAIGDTATVTVWKHLEQLTGYLDFALHGIDLKSSVKIRLEQPATWAAVDTTCPA